MMHSSSGWGSGLLPGLRQRVATGLEQNIWGVPRAIWVLVIGALFLRLLALCAIEGPDLISASESGVTAHNWVSSRGYTFDFYGYRVEHPLQSFMPPLFTIVVAGCLLTPWPEVVFGAVQIVLSSLTVLLVYLIAAQLSDRTVGFVAAAMTAVYPPFVILLSQRTASVLNAFLLGVWLWLSIKVVRTRDPRWAVLVGAVLGLSILSRPSFMGLLVVLLVALWLTQPEQDRGWGRAACVIVGFAALVIAPWMARNWAIYGRPGFISTNGGFNLWITNNPFSTGSAFDVVVSDLEAYTGKAVLAPDGATVVMVMPPVLPLELAERVDALDEIALDRAFYRAAFAFIRQQPRHWIGLLARKLVSLWWFRPNIGRSGGTYEEAWILPYQMLYATVLLFSSVGFILSLRHWRNYLVLYGTFAYLTLVYVFYNVITRYRWEMEPYILILASLALVQAWRWFGRTNHVPSCSK